jgi:hypothetical protein
MQFHGKFRRSSSTSNVNVGATKFGHGHLCILSQDKGIGIQKSRRADIRVMSSVCNVAVDRVNRLSEYYTMQTERVKGRVERVREGWRYRNR